MKSIIKTTCCALILAMVLPFLAACSLTPANPDASANPSSSAAQTETSSLMDKFSEAQLNTKVVEVGDYSSTLRDFITNFQSSVNAYLSYQGVDIMASPENIIALQENILDMLTERNIILYRAHEMGIDKLTAEQKDKLQKNIDNFVAEMHDTYLKEAQKQADNDPTIDVEAAAQKMLLEQASLFIGPDTTYDEYLEYVKKEQYEMYLNELLMATITKDTVITDDEISAWYTKQLETDKKTYTDDPSQYKIDRDLFDQYGTEYYQPITYIPDGYSRIFHIYVTSDKQFSDEYKKNLTSMDTLSAEYGKLAFEDALSGRKTNEKRMSEIISEYNALKKKTDEEHDTLFKDALDKINAAYTKLENGADFKTVMKEYTSDLNFLNFDYIKENGMIINPAADAATDWSKEVKAEFSKLEIGKYSEVFSDSKGYHIIFYASDETAGDISLDSMRETIKGYLLPTDQKKVYDSKLKEWKSDKSIKKNTELTDKVGISAT
ncbi:MAG: hypothetical protein RRY79_05260 [Clostridia bacterium]